MIIIILSSYLLHCLYFHICFFLELFFFDGELMVIKLNRIIWHWIIFRLYHNIWLLLNIFQSFVLSYLLKQSIAEFDTMKFKCLFLFFFLILESWYLGLKCIVSILSLNNFIFHLFNIMIMLSLLRASFKFKLSNCLI